MAGSSSSVCLASTSLDAHLRWKAIGADLLEYRRADGLIVAKERGLERNELGWEVKSRKAVRRNWNLEKSAWAV
jgi:hypothetical protein